MNPAVQAAINAINAQIIANGNQNITANILNPILLMIENSLYGITGNNQNLETATKVNLVAAINEIKNAVDEITGIKLYTGGENPNIEPPNGGDYNVLDFYTKTGVFGAESLWIYTGVPGIEWLNLVDGLKPPEWLYAENGATNNFPAMKKGQSIAIRVWDEEAEEEVKYGVMRIGGISGIWVGNHSLITAMEDSIGGSFDSVGDKYLIINQIEREQFYDEFSDFPDVGMEDILYVNKLDSRIYTWDAGNEIYKSTTTPEPVKKVFTYNAPDNTFDCVIPVNEVFSITSEGATFFDDGTNFTLSGSVVTVDPNILIDGKKIMILFRTI